MDVNTMTREDFQSLPHREWNEDVGVFDSLVIIPAEIRWWDIAKYNIIEWLKSRLSWFDSYYFPPGLHDSGYRCMDFVACKGSKPICRLSGCSDVIHLNGISGYGKNWLEKYGTVPGSVPPVAWSIDCLRESGYLHLFCQHQLEAGTALSSFELFVREKQQEATDG